MQLCTICSQWYAGVGIGWREICPDCWRANFSGNSLEAPSAREALEVYVFDIHHPTALQMAALQRLAAQGDAPEEYVDAQGPYQLTPRQHEAMAHLQEAWRRQEAGEA